jgi:glutathione S-transferase
MHYTLVGSTTSPFVRRIRLALEGIPYDFKSLNIYEGTGKSEINTINPANQIPCLLIDGKPLYDSRIILQYLNRHHGQEALTLEQENYLSTIERMVDAGVVIFMFRKSQLPFDNFYGERLLARIESVLSWLTPFLSSPAAKEWNSVTQMLYSALDWMQFREIHPRAQSAEVSHFLNLHRSREIVKQTDPRN